MGKALVIKGADFSRNYVDKITFEEEVPCTGLTLNKSTASLLNTVSTDTLVATVTPSNTTDAVIWSSSNADVVKVDNGVISAVGIGTATITVQCGNFFATCEVTCDGKVDVADSGYVASSGAFLHTQSANDYFNLASTAATDSFVVGQSTGSLHATNNESADGWLYPLIVPKNAKTLHIRCMDQYWGLERLGYLDSKVESTQKSNTAIKMQNVSGGKANLGWGDKTYNRVACYGNDVTLLTDITYDSLILGFKQQGSGDITPQVIANTHIWFEA